MSTESPIDHGTERLRLTSRKAWRNAMALALAAMVCTVLLSGLSAWFLGAVAIAGLSTAALTFNFHVPGALVRLFAVGRTAARYGERLTGHKAALTDQVLRRADLFRGMAYAPGTLRAGWQLGDQARLTDYIDDVEDLDYGKLRVDLPALSLGAGLVAVLAATAVVTPLAVVPIVLLLVLCALTGWRLALSVTGAMGATRESGRMGAEIAGAASAAVVPLRAERVWAETFAPALSAFAEADQQKLRLRRAQSGFDALCSSVGPLAGACVIVGAWFAGATGKAFLVPVFVAFAWLALSEALQGTSRFIVAGLRRTMAKAEIAKWTAFIAPSSPPATRGFSRLVCHALTRCAPDGRVLGAPLSLDLQRGKPTIVVGASGAGKTSLLKQIAGWVGDDEMTADEGVSLSASERRAMAMFCPHDAAILADTVRANLFAPGAEDVDLWVALEAVEMGDRIRHAGGLDGWITQETLSLGEAQRLNLARAFLTDKPLVLLDESAEHLDVALAGRVLQRLFDHLTTRIVVASSHRALSVEDAAKLDLDVLV